MSSTAEILVHWHML